MLPFTPKQVSEKIHLKCFLDIALDNFYNNPGERFSLKRKMQLSLVSICNLNTLKAQHRERMKSIPVGCAHVRSDIQEFYRVQKTGSRMPRLKMKTIGWLFVYKIYSLPTQLVKLLVEFDPAFLRRIDLFYSQQQTLSQVQALFDEKLSKAFKVKRVTVLDR